MERIGGIEAFEILNCKWRLRGLDFGLQISPGAPPKSYVGPLASVAYESIAKALDMTAGGLIAIALVMVGIIESLGVSEIDGGVSAAADFKRWISRGKSAAIEQDGDATMRRNGQRVFERDRGSARQARYTDHSPG